MNAENKILLVDDEKDIVELMEEVRPLENRKNVKTSGAAPTRNQKNLKTSGPAPTRSDKTFPIEWGRK